MMEFWIFHDLFSWLTMLHTFSEHLKLIIIMIIAMVHELCSQFRGQSGGIVHIVVQTTHLFQGISRAHRFTGMDIWVPHVTTAHCCVTSKTPHSSKRVPILHYLETPLFTFANGCEGCNIRYLLELSLRSDISNHSFCIEHNKFSFWNTLDPIATLQICNLLPRGSGPSLPIWPWLASARGGSTSGTQRYTWGSLHQQSNDSDQLRIVQISRNIPDTMTCHDSWFIFLLHIIYFVVFP